MFRSRLGSQKKNGAPKLVFEMVIYPLIDNGPKSIIYVGLTASTP